MDGSSKSKSANGSSLRRTAQKCPPDRLAASRCRRSASRRLAGIRRAKKQLRQCPDQTLNASDSDVPADFLQPRGQTINREDGPSIYDRLSFINNERIHYDDRNSHYIQSTNNPSNFINSNTIPWCFNCRDYISRLNAQTNPSYRSLPNYSINIVENNVLDLSPDSSSGPISFDSGIEQHNSLPYARSLNSSPYVPSLHSAYTKQDIVRLNLRDNLLSNLKLTNKPPLKVSENDDYATLVRNDEVHRDRYVNTLNSCNQNFKVTPAKSTKSVQTQTESIPVKFLPSTTLLDDWKAIETTKRKVKLLEVSRDTRQCSNEKRSWIKRSSATSNQIEEERERGYHSDSAADSTIVIIMPVGTSFENSAMKNSFSLSSLQATAGVGRSTDANGSPMRRPAPERPYHSLTKKRKDPNRDLWRRSWGSTHSNQSAQSLGSLAALGTKDDFWAALQPNYNYIMDNHLIETCKEANYELNTDISMDISIDPMESLPSTTNQRSLKQLIAEFTELCQWLTSLQEEVYASQENLANKTLRAAHMKALLSSEHRRLRFMEQAAEIIAIGEPEASAEVQWRARHLNLKWNSVFRVMNPENDANCENHSNADAEHELKCLRRWLHEMGKRIQPIHVGTVASWSRLKLDQKVKEHEVLQHEVQWQGRIVSSVVRLCRLGPLERTALKLEHNWYKLYIRALEWECQLKSCLANAKGSTEALPVSDSDEGPPVIKHPRLSGPLDYTDPINGFQSLHPDEDSYSEGDVDEDQCDGPLVPECFSLKDTSAGSEADTEGSIIDDDNDIIMDSLKNIDVLDNNADMPSIIKTSDSPTNCKNEDQVVIDPSDLKLASDLDVNSTLNNSMYDDDQTVPVQVVKRKKPVDLSKFNRSDRTSKNCATFYFRHQDTDSDRQMVSETSGTDDKSQEETSEEEWTYTMCPKNGSADNSDIMTSSFEQQLELPHDNDNLKEKSTLCSKLEYEEHANEKDEVDILNEKNMSMNNVADQKSDLSPAVNKTPRPVEYEIKRLLNEAEIMVLRKAQQTNASSAKNSAKKYKITRNFKPLEFNEESNRIRSQSKMSRIKEWLQIHHHSDNYQMILDSCDASGEYTTGDSEPDRVSVTSEDFSPSVATYRNVASSQEHSINIETPTNHSTPEHTKVVLRNKRNSSQNPRPWSVSCFSQLSYATKESPKAARSGSTLNTPVADGEDVSAAYGRTSGMSISESALNTLCVNMRGNSPKRGKYKYQGSTSSVKTTIQAGNISSSTTLNEGWNNSGYGHLDDSKHGSIRRKRSKLRKRQNGVNSNDLEAEELSGTHSASFRKGNKLVKSQSCSFPKHMSLSQKEFKQERCTSDPSTSRSKKFDTTSTSDNDSENEAIKKNNLLCLGRSTDRTLHASSEDQDNDIVSGMKDLKPKFKLGPEGGSVRPRLPLTNIDAVSRSALADLNADRDSDVDKSIQTAGTEHSSLSEQAWDSYQEKYNSEPYSEAPDSDAARRFLECDDYRAYIDSQSDCCSSLSAHPDQPSPNTNRRRFRGLNYSPTENGFRNSQCRGTETPNYGSYGRRSKKSSSSSIDRKKSLVDSWERSKPSPDNPDKIKRVKKLVNESLRNNKRSSISDCDLNRRRYTSSNSTNSDANNSSLEYHGNGSKLDIDSAGKKMRKQSFENKIPLSVELAMHDSTNNLDSTITDSPIRRKRFSNNHLDDSSDGGNNESNHSRRKGSGILLSMSNSNGDGQHLDSDSEVDHIRQLIETSRSQLENTELVLSKEDISMELLQPNDYNKILTTCRDNICYLEAVLEKASQGESSVLSSPQIREIKEMVGRWVSVERRSTARALRRGLLILKCEIAPLSPAPPLHTKPQLLSRLDQLKAKQSLLQDQKTTMLNLNVSVHRLLTEVSNNATGSAFTDTLCHNLKDDVNELYRIWEKANEITSTEITSLEGVLRNWGAWERGLAELHGVLKGDSSTLRLIETALQAGDPASVAPHVSQIARLLSETTHHKGECGSWSDSGISDSGSEQELSERERRLEGLRVLARTMEAALAPGSQLLKAITKKMDQAENELRSLQSACRALIVRTAGGVVNGNLSNDKNKNSISPTEALMTLNNGNTMKMTATSPDDPDSDPGIVDITCNRGKRWVWCTLPLQICLLALLCACFLGGPRCCDAVNNLGDGFTPHLRYVKGPPPV